VERGDVAALARTLSALIGDPVRRASMGRAGRRAVEDKFDLRRNVARLLEVYGVIEHGMRR